MKICEDCKYSFKAPELMLCCQHPKNCVTRIDLVHGYKIVNYRVKRCYIQRSSNTFYSFVYNLCGKKGRWFESKK